MAGGHMPAGRPLWFIESADGLHGNFIRSVHAPRCLFARLTGQLQ
jgi:hypothetical protein